MGIHPSQCYKEVMTIKPFADIVAKFDTGLKANVIHADEYKVDKSITFI